MQHSKFCNDVRVTLNELQETSKNLQQTMSLMQRLPCELDVVTPSHLRRKNNPTVYCSFIMSFYF